MSRGYIALYRELFNKAIWRESTPEQKVILVALLGTVNYVPRKWEWRGRPYLCQPGQKVTSVNGIQKICGKGVSRQNIRTALRRFEKLEFMTIEATKRGMLITICNWGLYQHVANQPNQYLTKGLGSLIKSEHDFNQQPNQETNQDENNISQVMKEVSDEAQKELTNELTDDLTFSQPTANHQLTTTKEVNKGNKDKKYTSDSDEFRLAELLLNLILQRKSDFREGQAERREKTLQRWAKDIDLMLRRDHRTPERIEAVIRFAQGDSGNGDDWDGWQNNILSTSKLRDKFDKLELAMSKGNDRYAQPLERDSHGLTPRERALAEVG